MLITRPPIPPKPLPIPSTQEIAEDIMNSALQLKEIHPEVELGHHIQVAIAAKVIRTMYLL